MSLSIGIVGFPNVGKSTLFNALLRRQVALVANYPFATIDPNVGIAEVPDSRLAALAALVNTSVIKPATVEFVDIAGLVEGASQGEGLGNKFLAHIRETDAICHVLRDFSDPQVLREGTLDPAQDIEAIRTELQLADLATLEKQTPPKGSTARADQERWRWIEQFNDWLNQGQTIYSRFTSMQKSSVQDEFPELKIAMQTARQLCLLTAKPEIAVINADEDRITALLPQTQVYAKQLGLKSHQVIIISAQVEYELSSVSSQEQQMYLRVLGLAESGLERLAKVAYQALSLQSFLTAGEKEVRAWTIERGATAQQAAGVIHTDFEKGFIRAEVMNWKDLVELGSEAAVREKGKFRIEGKEYVMQDGDVCHFRVGT